MPPITPARIAIASRSGAMRTRMSPGATSGSVAGVADVADRAQRLAVGVSSSKLWATAGAMASERCARVAGAAGAVGKRAVGGDPQRQRVARDQAFDRLGGGARLVLACGPASAALAWRMPLSPTQASAMPIGSSTAVRISRSLAAVGSRANRSASAHRGTLARCRRGSS